MARQRRIGSLFGSKRRRQQSPNNQQQRWRGSGEAEARSTERQRRSGGAVGASVSLRAASALLLRARLQEPTPTIRQNREEMAWTPATEQRRRVGEAVEAGGGAARSYSANQVALGPTKLQKNEVISPPNTAPRSSLVGTSGKTPDFNFAIFFVCAREARTSVGVP